MQELNGLRLHEGNVEDLPVIYPRLLRDFPPEELKSLDQFKQLMNRGHYKLYLAEHATLDILLGYAFVFAPKSPKIAWLDYLAIDEQYRNAGFGSTFIECLCSTFRSQRQGILLEVEVPASADQSILANQRRRISFYERVGAKQLNADYLFPAPTGPYPMLLFFRPIAELKVISREQIVQAVESAFEYIHTDVVDRKAILLQFQDSIQDTLL